MNTTPVIYPSNVWHKRETDLIFAEMEEMRKSIRKLQNQCKAIDDDHCKFMEDRYKALSGRFQEMLKKVTIATEAAFYARHSPKLNQEQRTKAFDAAVMALEIDPNELSSYLKLSVKEMVFKLIDNHTSLSKKMVDLRTALESGEEELGEQ